MPVSLKKLVGQLLNQSQKKWPSLTRPQLASAFETVTQRHRGKNMTVGDLSVLVEEELTRLYGEPQA